MDTPDRRADLSRPIEELHPNERLKHEQPLPARHARGGPRGSAHRRGRAIRIRSSRSSSASTSRTTATCATSVGARSSSRAISSWSACACRAACARPQQWLALDALARASADGTLRLTTRQTFQFHGVRKRNLQEARAARSYATGLDTLAACGDVNRNVISTANPLQSPAHAAASALAKQISAHLLPHTGAYHEICLGEEPVADGRRRRAALRTHVPAAQVQDRDRGPAAERRRRVRARPGLHRHLGRRPTGRVTTSRSAAAWA